MLISCPECHFKRHVDEKQIPESATLATCPKCQNKFRFRDPETGAFLSDICLESEQGVNRTEAGNAQETLNAAPAGSPADNETQNPNQENMANEAEDVSGAAPAKPASSVTNGANGEDPVPLTEEDMPHKLKNSENPLQEPQFQAYEQAAKKRTQQYVMMTDDVPWEHPERYGILGALVQTVSRVMFRGREFFSTIHSRVSSLRPASFYALIGVFQALVAYFLSPNVLETGSHGKSDFRAKPAHAHYQHAFHHDIAAACLYGFHLSRHPHHKSGKGGFSADIAHYCLCLSAHDFEHSAVYRRRCRSCVVYLQYLYRGEVRFASDMAKNVFSPRSDFHFVAFYRFQSDPCDYFRHSIVAFCFFWGRGKTLHSQSLLSAFFRKQKHSQIGTKLFFIRKDKTAELDARHCQADSSTVFFRLGVRRRNISPDKKNFRVHDVKHSAVIGGVCRSYRGFWGLFLWRGQGQP